MTEGKHIREILGEDAVKAITEEANKLLEQRYLACDLEGHLDPDKEQNLCTNCYRHLEYKTPRTDARYKLQDELPTLLQPFNAVQRSDERKNEIDIIKLHEYFDGVSRIRDELLAKRGMK